MAGTFGALRSPLFRRVEGAVAVANVGDWFQITGRGVLVYQATGSTAAVGSVYLATYLPQLVLLPVAGLVADRYDRRRFLLATSAAQVVCAALLAWLSSSASLSLAAVLAVSLVQGTAVTLAAPVGLAMQPALVPPEAVASAVTVSVTVANVARVIGPLLAGVVIAGPGIGWLFGLAAASYLGVTATWWVTRVGAREPDPGARTTLASLSAGARHVRSTPQLSVPIGLLAVLSAVGLVYQPLGVAFATAILSHGDRTTGTTVYTEIQAAIGVGAVLGVALTTRLATRPVLGLAATGVVFSGALAGFGLAPSAGTAVGIAALLGAAHFANSNLVLILVQSSVPEALRGRVMAVVLLAWVGTIPVSALVLGVVAQHAGTRATIVGCAVVCLLASVTVLRHTVALRTSAALQRAPGPAALPLEVLVAEEV